MKIHVGKQGLFLFPAIICWATLAQGSATMTPSCGTAEASSLASTQGMSDRQLAKTVHRAIEHSGEIYTADMAVRAKDGVVTLVGSVPTASDVTQAAEVAHRVQGVVLVNNLRPQTQGN